MRERGDEPALGCSSLLESEVLLAGLGVDNVGTILFFPSVHYCTKEYTDLHRKGVRQAP